MATVTQTYETDELAQRFFKNALPAANWLIREQKPDFHIDYLVEVVDVGEPSGLTFAVQLKGSRSLTSSHRYLKLQMKVKHLKYYLNNVRSPVFF